jgi:hypothetical protein
VKDADGNLIESGILEIIESKGTPITFDYEGNLVMIKYPKLKTTKKVSY